MTDPSPHTSSKTDSSQIREVSPSSEVSLDLDAGVERLAMEVFDIESHERWENTTEALRTVYRASARKAWMAALQTTRADHD